MLGPHINFLTLMYNEKPICR